MTWAFLYATALLVGLVLACVTGFIGDLRGLELPERLGGELSSQRAPRSTRAARRAAATIVCGVLISLLYKIPGGTHLLLRFPELLMAQIGGVLLIAEFLNFRLLGEKNPPAAPEETAAIQTIYQTSGLDLLISVF